MPNEADGSSCGQISCKLAADTHMYTRTHDQMHYPFPAYTAGRKQKCCLHKFYIKYIHIHYPLLYLLIGGMSNDDSTCLSFSRVSTKGFPQDECVDEAMISAD